MKLSNWWHERLERSRLHLARPDALLHLAGLGLLTGLLAGVVIVLFRVLVEGSQDLLLPGSGAENYEGLGLLWRLGLPIAAGLLLAAMFRWTAKGIQMLGVAEVMERMAYHQGYLTLRGLMLQFIGAAFAIVGGHSVGREGPHVYLGSAAGSLLGQKLSLPNNAIRTLVGCGTAAGIAASFNTPLAGVAFALEVVMMEYSVASFIPVILAAVSAATLSNVLLGTEPAFAVPTMRLDSLAEMGFVVVLGIAAGALSAGFIQLVQFVASRTRGLAIWWRMLLAGGVMAAFGAAVPQVMGIGYDSVSLALHASLAIGVLALLIPAKLLATSVAVGLGVPGGLIGPALFIGAMLGALVAEIVGLLDFGLQPDVGFLALLGMGAMMSASLQAPLAALMAMLELTHNPEVILPGMLAVVVAGLTASEVFHKESLFVSTLKARGRDYAANPVLQALRRVGVASVMDKRFVRVDCQIDRDQATQFLAAKPYWVLIDQGGKPRALMPAIDLLKFLESGQTPDREQRIDLLEIPAQRLEAAPVHLQETLQQALERLDAGEGEALYVERVTAPGIRRIYGILTRQMVESSYRY